MNGLDLGFALLSGWVWQAVITKSNQFCIIFAAP